MKWVSDAIVALKSLGGEASNTQIYHWIESNRPGPFPENWKSVIRATLQAYAVDSAQYRVGNPGLFKNVARGYWALDVDCKAGKVLMRDNDAVRLAIQAMTTDDIAATKSDEELLLKLAQRGRELGPMHS